MTEPLPLWRKFADDALVAAIEGDDLRAAMQISGMLSCDDELASVVSSAVQRWNDVLAQVAPPQTPMPVIDAASAGLTDAQGWGMQVIAARVNNEARTELSVVAAAIAESGELLMERLVALVILIGAAISGDIESNKWAPVRLHFFEAPSQLDPSAL